MKFWNASIGFLTLLVRAESAEQAKALAWEKAAEYGMEACQGYTCEPEVLSPYGPAEVLIEDPS